MTRDDKRASSKHEHESVPGPAWPLPADDPGGGVPPIDDFPASERVWKADGASVQAPSPPHTVHAAPRQARRVYSQRCTQH